MYRGRGGGGGREGGGTNLILRIAVVCTPEVALCGWLEVNILDVVC